MTIFIMTVIMVLTLLTPFAVKYGIKIAKRKNFKTHRKIQNFIFLVCLIGLFILEGLINYSGGSGSIASGSKYYKTPFFSITLYSHIIVAILTYVLWAFQILISNFKYRKTLPGPFSKTHRIIGYSIFAGLIYTAVTSFIVYVMSLNLV